MGKVALRGLLARKLRLALTALAVALGVTLIAGTYVFTDTINGSFDKLFTQISRGTDVAVKPSTDLAGDQQEPPAMPAAVLDKIRSVPGVAAADGGIFSGGGTFRKADGSKLKGQGFNAIASVSDIDRFRAFAPTEGRFPRTADEVAIPKGSADANGFKVGDRLQISAGAPKKSYTITGIVQVPGVASLGGGTIAVLTLPEAQRLTGKGNAFDQIDVAAAPGVSKQVLKDRIAKVVPARIDVRTGQEDAAKQSQDIRKSFLSFLRTALLAFAGISLFVGAFIIFNTFSITVQQRTREFALLRMLGAKRRQVLRSVLAEGFVIGVLGSLAGVGLGILTAAGLKALFKAVGVDLPASSTVISARTIIVSLLVGTIVTLIATTAPALRATRVPPIAALQEGYIRLGRRSRLATPLAGALTALGVGLMALGLFGSMKSNAALSLLGGGALATFLGVALLSPRLVGPLASVVGRPIERMRGLTGRLARENSVRQPGRTAVTAAALMVGVALVTFASIFAAGAKTTVREAVTNGSKAQAVVQNQEGFGSFSHEATQAVAQTPGVRDVASIRFAQGRVNGEKKSISGVDPATFSALYHAGWKQGGDATMRALAPGQTIVSKGYAEAHSTKVGQNLTVRTVLGKTLALRVTGILDDRGGLTGDLTVPNEVVERDFGGRKDDFVLVGFASGTTDARTLASVKKVLDTTFPEAKALTNGEFIKQQEGQVDQLLGLIYALLALAIIVSLFGIVNTLVLSITERTRELGMLRAVGMSRRQVRRVIRYEAVITAVIGGIIGLGLGIVLAVLVTRAIDGFSLSIPVGQLAFVLVLSAVAGVVAAVLPARRASRLDVLESLAYE
jgi:putative ABC transport system permease protein